MSPRVQSSSVPLGAPAPWLERYAPFLLILAVTLPWWIAVGFPFIHIDDPRYVSQNGVVLSGLNRASIPWALTTWMGDFWLPMTWLSLLLDATLFGRGPAGFHATNVALHVASAMLVFAVLRELTASRGRSLLVALLFAMHPLRVESVAWVTERKDVLSALFGLLAMLAYVRFVRTSQWWRYILACGCFALSLMSKPMLVTLPFLLLLLDFWPLDRIRRQTIARIVLEKIPFLILAAAISVLTYHIQSTRGVIRSEDPLLFRLQNAALSLALYLRNTFYFGDLSVYYPKLKTIPPEQSVGAILLIAAITISLAWLAWKKAKARPLLVGWLWFCGTLVPTLGILQSGEQSRADRFTYFPAIGLLLALVWAWPAQWLAAPDTRSRNALAAVLVAVVAVSMTVRLLLWQDPLQLYLDGLAHTHDNWYLETMAGQAFRERRMLPEALAHFTREAELSPFPGPAWNNVGSVLAQMGRLPEAVAAFRKAHELDPHDELFASNYNRSLRDLSRRQTGTMPASAGSSPAKAGPMQESP
jgi:tetratricopeptide (TPR) repeat protein